MKHYFYLLALCLICFACDGQLKIKDKEGKTKLLYSGNRYDLVEVNDSLYMIIPGLNSKDTDQPQIILKRKDGNYVDSHDTRITDSTQTDINFNNIEGEEE